MTMTEIARLAGVSQATVSRVLSGNGPVAHGKRDAVLRVVGETNYLLRGRQRHGARQISIGVLLLDDTLANPGIMMRKYESLAGNVSVDCNVVLLPSGLPVSELRAVLRRREIRGLLLVGHHCGDPALGELLRSLPHVWLNSHSHGSDSKVLGGNEAAGRLAAEYLLRNGRRRLAVLSVKSENPGFAARVAGFRFEVFASGMDSRVLGGDDGTEFETLADAPLERLLAELVAGEALHGIDGFFVPDDRLTALVHRVLLRRGTPPARLPLMVSCNHEEQFLTGLYPRPATIDLAPGLTAKLALEQLLRMLHGERREDRAAIVVSPELIAGEEKS